MLKTLQWYIARELFKTFVLTAFGLTLVFSLCGGVLNMIQAEVLTAVQVARILLFVLPVATTLTLPVSAMFASAIVYGRFAADNEFDACKASGINIHRLLAPAMALSILTAAFTFTFTNYVIPRFIEQLEVIVRSDIQKVVTQALTTRGYLKYGSYVMHARQVHPFEDAADQSRGLIIKDAAFLMIEKDELTRCGTANQVDVLFKPGKQVDEPMVEAVMKDVVALDLSHVQLHQQALQPFTPMQVPRNFDEDPKWLNLTDLLVYLKHPMEFSKVRGGVLKVRMLVRDALFYQSAVRELTGPAKVLRLADARRSYEIRAEAAELSEDDYRPTLRNATIIESWEGGRTRRYQAERCSLRVKRGYAEQPDMVHVSLSGRVKFVDSLEPHQVNEPKTTELEDVTLPGHILEAEKKVTDADLLGVDPSEFQGLRYDLMADREPRSLELGSRVQMARTSLLREISLLGLDISSMIHSRLAFSASTLVLLILAAGLAIIFRGGQLLTAFVISFAPGMLVVVLNITGRQLAEKPGTYLLGLGLIWVGIGLLALADAVVLTRFLRR